MFTVEELRDDVNRLLQLPLVPEAFLEFRGADFFSAMKAR